ncbi:MAG TPA: Fe-S cluster assembly ATPase SufC [Methanothermococcus okinawensis]|uniref:Fe-S cluster assembly ATPase SufC n=1 Tax=Methanothermococcus okinawensis TaxID=155863 RepID=A0A832ZDA6_9EURY|nr:Fe-S cluster assembly ATPase SufC [Methanothermococcus okinawensis]HIP90884.1 Fe-S cluster assembly ATPase SufC [Methanothermococcus okinawensis]
MLSIENLSVKVEDKVILRDVNLRINVGEAHVLFGPNGAGKSTLINTIMGHPRCKVVEGSIYFKGRDITDMPIDERARLGIGLAYQNPPGIPGVKLKDLLKIIAKVDWEEIERMAEILNFKDFLDREVNVGFSGGEVKKSELLQIFAQNPDFMMFDEPDSGVDVENVKLIGHIINHLLEKDRKPADRRKSGLIITHMGHILKFIHVDRAHILYNGVIACSGSPEEILNTIIKYGYERCIKCYQKRRQNG